MGIDAFEVLNMDSKKNARKIGFLFPGQGAQFVGMGKEIYSEFSAVRDVFGQASDALGYDLAEKCFTGPEETLTRSDICQPAILTTSIAALTALNEIAGEALSPSVYAGLSLGEYSALVAAGQLGLESAVKLTAARGKFMQEACDINPGTMYSILGLESGAVENVCNIIRENGGLVWAANYNSPTQLVISGEAEAAGQAAEMCTEKGAGRTIELKVAGAFHTPLMQPAADNLAKALKQETFSPGSSPVLSNVGAIPHGSAAQVRDMLARQVTEPVKWVQSVEWCREKGITEFIEIGPGKVVSGLIRRIDRSMKSTPVLSPESINKYINKVNIQ